jgi:chorismate-pyruvate lyase
LYAEATVVPERVQAWLVEELMGTDKPIGALLSEYRIESRRDILVIDREPAGPCGAYFGIAPSAPALFRTYRIVAGGHPISLITEKFPAAAFVALPA